MGKRICGMHNSASELSFAMHYKGYHLFTGGCVKQIIMYCITSGAKVSIYVTVGREGLRAFPWS